MTYDGGKNSEGVYKLLINQIPPHTVYVEPFLGSGAVLRHKRPARFNIGIEKDGGALAAVQPHLSSVDVTLLQGDALLLLPLVVGRFVAAGEDVFIYADPPYLMAARSWQGALYNCEFGTEAEHLALLRLLDALPCRVMLSGYHSALYCEHLTLPKWRAIQFQAMTHRGPRTEWLWMNYRDPVELHDYTHLGTDRTDRQRIKRRIESWTRKMMKMPAKERNAIFQACQVLQTELSASDRKSEAKTKTSARDHSDRADELFCTHER